MSEEITPSGTKQTSATTEETTTVSSESLGGVTEEMTGQKHTRNAALGLDFLPSCAQHLLHSNSSDP